MATVNRRKALAFLLASVAPGGQAVAAAAVGAPPPPYLLRGFNLPDQVPARAELSSAQTVNLTTLRNLGMTHVRLPVVAESMLANFSPPATMALALADLDRTIERFVAMGYHVSVDLHPGEDLQAMMRSDFPRAKTVLLAGWINLARHLSRWSSRQVSAELLNEPVVTDELWRPFVEQLAGAVRAELPHHTIVVGSAPYQRGEALMDWRPLPGGNIVYACHYYDPMMFTHQGASWDPSSPWSKVAGVPFPTVVGDPRVVRMAESEEDPAAANELRQLSQQAWNANVILAQFQTFAAWSAANNAPIIINEFGVLKWKAPRADRIAWISAICAAAEACGFGWAHWDYITAFGLLDDQGAFDGEVIRALLGRQPGFRLSRPLPLRGGVPQ